MGKLVEKDKTVYIGNFFENFKHGYGEMSRGELLTEGFWINDEYKGTVNPFDD